MKNWMYSMLLIVSFYSHASTVIWDCFSLVENSTGKYELSWSHFPTSHEVFMLYPDVFFDLSSDEAKLRFSATGAVCEFVGQWAEVDEGAILDSSTMNYASKCFYFNDPNYPERIHSDADILASLRENIYLGVKVQEDMSGKYCYGWVNLYLKGDGSVSLVSSAIDIDGGPMIVGGGAYSIPEPSGGLLFVLGAAALGLRRRRVSPPYHGGVRSRAAAASAPDLPQSTPKTRISSARRWR